MKKNIDIRGKAFGLKNFVEYQAAAVVSREILNRKTGTVTVFSFGKGEGLSEHTAPFDALVYVVDGKTKISDVVDQTAKELGSPVKLVGFARFALGEGIEKVETDFAAEVQAQAKAVAH